MPKKTDDLATRARAYFRARELGKKHYAKADEILAKISLEVEHGHAIDLGDKGKAVFINNVVKARENKKYPNPTQWTMAGAREFELELRR